MNPYLRRIRWRLIWMSVLVLLLSVGSFCLSHWVYNFSDDECTWRVESGHVMIREILPNGVAEEAGVLEGDELISIQGRAVTTAGPGQGILAAQTLINSKPEGTVLSYAVKRNGKILYLPVRLVKPLDAFRLALLISGLIAWAIGLLVVISTPERKSARHFFYLACLTLLSSCLGQTFRGNSPPALLFTIFAVGVTVFAALPPMWVHFFLRFPHPFEARKNRHLIQGLYAGFAMVALISVPFLLNTLILPILKSLNLDPNSQILGLALFFIPNAIRLVTFTASAMAGLALFIAGYRRLPERGRRALLVCILVTAAVGVDLLFMQYVSLKAANRNSLIFTRQRFIFMLPLPLVPLSFGYAIIRHGLFDVRRALLRWISYFTVLGAFLALYLGGLAWIFAMGLGATVPTGWLGALLGLAALPLGWAFRGTVRRIRKRFRRDLQSAREQVLAALREPRKRLSEEAMLKALSDALQEAFRPQMMLVLPFERNTILLPAVEASEDHRAYPAESLSLPASLLRHARENRELVLGLGSEEADWIREQDPQLREHVDALEAQLLLLVLVGDAPHTALLLGGKYAELNYGRDDRELLREAAIATGVILETAVMHRRVMAQERLSQELETARRIQEGLITTKPPPVPGFQMALRLEPALETGGDLLFVKRRPSGKWLAAVGDISGKGLAAALYMAQATALLEQATQLEDLPLENILYMLDETLRHLLGSNGFLTLAIAEWDEEGNYRLARAGHPPALLLEATCEGGFREVSPKGRGLGLRPAGPRDWQILEGVLPPRGWLVLYSDGLTEAMNRHGELYGLDRFAQQLMRLRGTGSVRAACEAVFSDVATFDTQNRDDRTLFILGREATA